MEEEQMKMLLELVGDIDDFNTEFLVKLKALAAKASEDKVEENSILAALILILSAFQKEIGNSTERVHDKIDLINKFVDEMNEKEAK